MGRVHGNRKQSTVPMLVISTGLFVLAVLFSLIGGIGFYLSLALVVIGGFSMIIVGMARESNSKTGVANTYDLDDS